MKYIYSLLLFISLTKLSAQITIVSSDLPAPGDTLVQFHDTIPTFGPGPSGTAIEWNFSSAVTHYSDTTFALNPSNTPNASLYPSANLALTRNSSSFLYFSNSVNEYLSVGASGDLLQNGLNLNVNFSPSLTLHQFPRQFGSQFNLPYGFQAEADGSSFGVYQIRVIHRGTYSSNTDGWGTITTPVGTYDALRIKNADITVDSVFIKVLPITGWTFFTAISDTSITYDWLAKETKLPVASMQMDSVGNAVSFTWSAIPPASGTYVENQNVEVSNSVFPNPAASGSHINLGFDPKPGAGFVLLNTEGKIVMNSTFVTSTTSLCLPHLPGGIYLFVVKSSNGSVLKKGKLIVKDL